MLCWLRAEAPCPCRQTRPHSGDFMNTSRRLILSCLLLGASAAIAWSQSLLAPTPPMGWNSWDSFGTGVTEAEVKANADYMSKYMAKSGWQYIVVDIQW